MPRATVTTENPEPEQQQDIAQPSIGRVLLVWSLDCTTPEQATVVRVHNQQADGTWLVNLRTTADGPMSQDRWITSARLVPDADAASAHPRITAWWPPRV